MSGESESYSRMNEIQYVPKSNGSRTIRFEAGGKRSSNPRHGPCRLVSERRREQGAMRSRFRSLEVDPFFVRSAFETACFISSKRRLVDACPGAIDRSFSLLALIGSCRTRSGRNVRFTIQYGTYNTTLAVPVFE